MIRPSQPFNEHPPLSILPQAARFLGTPPPLSNASHFPLPVNVTNDDDAPLPHMAWIHSTQIDIVPYPAWWHSSHSFQPPSAPARNGGVVWATTGSGK